MVKLCVPEAESAALLAHLVEHRRTISSELTVVEVARAAFRAAGGPGLAKAEQACARLDLLAMSGPILARARTLGPAALRSLDAIHLATALEPRTPPVVVAYDDRLLQAARAHDLQTVSPGR